MYVHSEHVCMCVHVCTKRYRMCIDKFFCTVPGDGGAATNRVRTEYIYSMRLQMYGYILYGVCVCVFVHYYCCCFCCCFFLAEHALFTHFEWCVRDERTSIWNRIYIFCVLLFFSLQVDWTAPFQHWPEKIIIFNLFTATCTHTWIKNDKAHTCNPTTKNLSFSLSLLLSFS